MDGTPMVAAFVVIDDAMQALGHRTHTLAEASDSEVLTVAVAAAQFGNRHERALCVLRALGYLSGPLSVSRFNRRLHALADGLPLLLDVLGASSDCTPALTGRRRGQGCRCSPPAAPLTSAMPPRGDR